MTRSLIQERRQRGLKSRQGGFSLIELMIALTLLASVMLLVSQTTTLAIGTYRMSQAEEDLIIRANRTLAFIASQFSDAERDNLTPEPAAPDGSNDLTFHRCVGYDAGAPQWGANLRIEFRIDDSELDDGVDNDGDGLVDEGTVVFTTDPGGPNEREVIKAHSVREFLEGEIPNGLDDNGNDLEDESGLAFLVEGNLLTIFLTLEAVGPGDRLLTKTVQTSVHIQN